MIETFKSADLSSCGRFRYVLKREWGITQRPIAMCIGLNPSTANSEKDDPTIRILVKALNHLGFGELRMLNLYSLISSDPKKLFEVPDAQGANDWHLAYNAKEVDEIIFCWGSFKGIEYRAKKMISLFHNAKCFGKTKDGSPMHPMAIMYQGIKAEDLKLIPFQ